MHMLRVLPQLMQEEAESGNVSSPQHTATDDNGLESSFHTLSSSLAPSGHATPALRHFAVGFGELEVPSLALLLCLCISSREGLNELLSALGSAHMLDVRERIASTLEHKLTE
jgi:hypothetical protein